MSTNTRLPRKKKNPMRKVPVKAKTKTAPRPKKNARPQPAFSPAELEYVNLVTNPFSDAKAGLRKTYNLPDGAQRMRHPLIATLETTIDVGTGVSGTISLCPVSSTGVFGNVVTSVSGATSPTTTTDLVCEEATDLAAAVLLRPCRVVAAGLRVKCAGPEQTRCGQFKGGNTPYYPRSAAATYETYATFNGFCEDYVFSAVQGITVRKRVDTQRDRLWTSAIANNYVTPQDPLRYLLPFVMFTNVQANERLSISIVYYLEVAFVINSPYAQPKPTFLPHWDTVAVAMGETPHVVKGDSFANIALYVARAVARLWQGRDAIIAGGRAVYNALTP